MARRSARRPWRLLFLPLALAGAARGARVSSGAVTPHRRSDDGPAPDAQLRAIREALPPELLVRVLDSAPFRARVALCSGCAAVSLWGRGGPLRLGPRGDGRVVGLEFFDSGARLLTWSSDGSAAVWDAATGQLLQEWRGPGPVECARVFPGGRRAVTCVETGACSIWELGASHAVATFATRSVRGVEVFPSGVRLLTWGRGPSTTVRDSGTGAMVCALQMRTLSTSAAKIFPDGRKVVTSTSLSSMAVVWDASSCQALHHLDSPDDLLGLAVLTGGDILAMIGTRSLTTWNPETGLLLRMRTFDGLASPYFALGFASFGDRVVTFGGILAVVWDARFATVLQDFTAPSRLHSVAMSPAGDVLLGCSSGRAFAWSLRHPGSLLHTWEEPAEHAAAEDPDSPFGGVAHQSCIVASSLGGALDPFGLRPGVSWRELDAYMRRDGV